MEDCQTLITAALVITQNGKRDIGENWAVAIKKGLISDIGPAAEVGGRWNPDETISAPLVMPGLINAHTHAAMTFLRGLADDLPLMEWLEQNIFPVEARLTREITYLGSLLGYAEMLASGTTACLDMYIHEDSVFEAADTAGLRCTGGEAVFAFPSARCPSWREALELTKQLAEKYAANDRINIAANPHSVYTTTPQILAACRDLALELDIPLHIHLGETPAETSRCIEAYGMRPVAWCAANGLLETRMTAAHLVDITEDEIEILASAGACGAHNPSSNMKLASGIAPVPKMLEHGLSLGLGTDGPASNNTLNMFVEMGRAALLHKISSVDPTAMPAGAVLDMATLGGAKALGNTLIGSLEIGKSADLIILDSTCPNMAPMHNPVSQVVYSATGHECRLAMVGGEVLYKDGKFTRFDYEALLGEVEKLKKFVQNKYR